MLRTPVRLHLAIREGLEQRGEPFARQLASASSEGGHADALARELLGVAGADRPPAPSGLPVLHHFGAPELPPELDRMHLVLAMLWSEVATDEDARIPRYALLHEVRSLEPESLDRAFEGLALAAKAYAYSSGGYCDLVEPLVDGERVDPPPEAMGAWADGDRERGDAARNLGHLQRFLVDGSLACCAMRSGRVELTAQRLERSIADAERLGVCEHRLPLIRAWAALLRGNRELARQEIDRVDVAELHESDFARLRLIRSALATEGTDAAERALLRTMDQHWLSRLVVSGAFEAIETSNLAPVLRDGEAARAARRFVEGEVAVVAEARRIDPFFEQR